MENEISKKLEQVKQHEDFIDLIHTNFSDCDTSEIDNLLRDFAGQYFVGKRYQPDSKGLLSCRKAIVKYHSKQGAKPDPRRITITASTSESYSLIFNSLDKERDEVLLPNPGYPLFEYLAGFSGLKVKYYPLLEEHGWEPDFNYIAKALNAKTRAAVVISPNNPTGSVLTKENWQKLAAVMKESKVPLIIDEVFHDFTFTSNKYDIDLNSFDFPAFKLNGISKTLALPDMKLAWIVCNDKCPETLLEEIEMANDVYLNANYFMQNALPEVFKLKDTVQQPILKTLKHNLNALKAVGLDCVLPQGGIHCMLRLNLPQSEEENIVLGLLEKKHVSVHPGFFYDYQAKQAHLVISLLQKEENFTAGLSRIQEFVIECKRSR